MEANEVQALVAAAFPDGDVEVDLNGGHYTVTVVSADFEGVRPVARQQKVYAPLAGVIAGPRDYVGGHGAGGDRVAAGLVHHVIDERVRLAWIRVLHWSAFTPE